MISPENNFQCTFRIIGTDKIEISTTCQVQQSSFGQEDWSLFLEIFIEKIQTAIATVDSLKSHQSHQSPGNERFSEALKVWDFATSTDSNSDCQDERFIKKVMTVLEHQRSNVDFNTEEFSKEVCLSRSQLHRRLKLLTGYTTNGLIRLYRLEYARRLILKRFGNVAQIAYECGFSNPSYFAECFKRQFGVLPSEYAKTAG